MKRFVFVCVVCVAIYACDKETADPVYDSHLFQALQAHNWVMDSAKVTDSLERDTFLYAVDTVNEITQFTSSQYTINNVRVVDSLVKDTTAYQVIYNSPNQIYFYNNAEQAVLLNQYLNIDSVNAEALILTIVDTFKNTSRKYYHAY